MTPTAKQLAQSSAAKIIINAEISFRRRVSSEANRRIFTCPAGRVGDHRESMSALCQWQMSRCNQISGIDSSARRARGCREPAVASSEAIVQAKPNDIEAVVKGCVERRETRLDAVDEAITSGSCEPHCLGTQIDKLIFDLRAPMLV